MYDDIGKLIEDLTYKYVTPIQDTHKVIVDVTVIDVLGGYGETLSGQITCGGIQTMLINVYGKPFEIDGDLNVIVYNTFRY